MRSYNPWQYPENPFDYVALVSDPEGIGPLPPEKWGTKVAIIGAGCSGLCAAYELIKVGLHPVIYEAAQNPDGTPRMGGRVYTYRFPGDPRAFAELGAMRIPAVNRTIGHYMDQFGIDYGEIFPDPLLVPTNLYFNGQRYFIPLGGKLPPEIERAAAAWKDVIDPLVEQMARAWEDPVRREQQWSIFVEQYANKTFYEVLYDAGLSPREIQLFGSLGLGTGGFDSLYPISFIEILRIVTCQWETDQRLIKGGVDQLPNGFWKRKRDCTHWGRQSVRGINEGQPLPAVTEIFTPTNPKDPVVITDASGRTESYAAAIITCSLRALEMNVKINRETFSDEVWTAIQNIHLINSGKVFVRTKTTFWKDLPPEETLTCTITDEATRGTYLFEFEDTPSGVICLSYSWGDSATKFEALSEDQRLQKALHTLEKIYGRDLISDQVEESISYYWQQANGYNGAFKLTFPGQYHHQMALFQQPFTPRAQEHNGVFLAGETTSWSGGWIEGALHSGLDAARAVVARLGTIQR
jgi:monoamine oxidase